ncbi:MAG: 50S ribosomal protein L18 [Verrucomicrobia subdivision 3 bacterium]|nr:50S ribosomal protein L18 [Limisphaerales bacterium]MCS1415986.1 50S ribosomal protein L18 [Limisphaerales bacterium]
MKTEKRIKLVKRRRYRIRKKVLGTSERPRMSVRFTGRNAYVQFIDDAAGTTLASVSSLTQRTTTKDKFAANVASAEVLGSLAASAAKEKGISTVVFDRSGARYHGKVKALADAARAAGLEF